ncbi:uncharacterized protein BDZ99DRAFT_465988 [Mytilinidion resinicola]|uniref:Uncharacterized protein n=1 Tax=Mytilinidion resinicola TaxID=574789 RepID=A0A6A6YC74_9PEZI|nr:uncharacterized protein BDZ99DRAFT_465988 [Mytilinidion resinicola]KAF2806411.1 hypothetical protein BDZ99DRAFT_465988 [Mytilinidion resinicola]
MLTRMFNLTLEQHTYIRRLANLTDREIMKLRVQDTLPGVRCTVLDTQAALAELDQIMILVARRFNRPATRFENGRDPVHRRRLYPTPTPSSGPLSERAPRDAWLARTKEADKLYHILATWMRRFGGLAGAQEGFGEVKFGKPIVEVAQTLFRTVRNVMGDQIAVSAGLWWKYVRRVLLY